MEHKRKDQEGQNYSMKIPETETRTGDLTP